MMDGSLFRTHTNVETDGEILMARSRDFGGVIYWLWQPNYSKVSLRVGMFPVLIDVVGLDDFNACRALAWGIV